MSSIQNICKELFEYLKISENEYSHIVSEQEFLHLEQSIKLQIPNSLKENLLYCDNLSYEVGIKFYNLNEIIEIYQDGIEYGYILDKSLIPICDWNGDIFIFVSSINEEIIYQDLEFGVVKKIFNSFEDFLIHIKENIIKNGKYKFTDMKKIINKI